MKPIYYSYSGMSTINKCARLSQFIADPKTYKPHRRSISLVKGGSIHDAINTLIESPDYSPGNEFIAAFNLEEGDSEIPIDFGSKGREKHIQEGMEMVEAFWSINGPASPNPMDIRASERWFFFSIKLDDGTEVWIRGRFDGIINIDGDLYLDDWKSGKPTADEIKFNPQMLIQILGFRYGYVTVEDNLAYIGPSNDAYHIHEFEPMKNKPDHYSCKICSLMTRKYGVYPAGAMIYHVGALVPTAREKADRWEVFKPAINDDEEMLCPNACGQILSFIYPQTAEGNEFHGYQYDKPGWTCPSCKCRIERRCKKTTSKKPEKQNIPQWVYKVGPDIPKGNPEFKIDFDEEKIGEAYRWMREAITRSIECKKSNDYPQTQNVGFGSPCTMMGGCDYINLCDNKEMCSVTHDKEAVFDVEAYKWVKPDESTPA